MARVLLLHPVGIIHPRGSGQIVARSAVTAPPPDAVTWSPSASEPNYQFSYDRLSAKTSGKAASSHVIACGNTSKASGYFEIVVTAAGGNMVIGLTSAARATSDFIGDTEDLGYGADGNIYHHLGGILATYSTYTTGDTIRVYRSGNFAYFGKNGVWQNSADPSAGTGGIDVSAYASSVLYPAVSTINSALDVTARFTAASMAYAIPTGGTAWDGTTVDVTVALTGQALTAALGSLLPNVAIALTGQPLSVTQGTLTPSTSEALSGQALTVGQGSVSPATAPALSGQAVSVAGGSVAPATSPALSGQSASVAQGSVSPSASVAISGQSLIVAQGAVFVASSTVALTGLSISVASGTLAPSASLALIGQPLTIVSGAILPAITLSITGQTLAVAQGALIVQLGAGQIKVDLGSFVAKPVKVWNGIAWVTKPLKRWTGTLWQATGY